MIIFVVCVALLLQAGCSTSYYNLATQREEWVLYSTDKEVEMGRKISRQLEKRLKVLEDQTAQDRVNTIGQKLAAHGDRKELLYYFKVLDLKEVNAISLPGGYVYVNRGLLEKIKSDDELAGVLAHEIGHIAARHAMKRLQASMGYGLLQALAVGTGTNRQAIRGAQIAFTQIFLAYSRGDELQADRLAVKTMRRAGYDPYGMSRFLKKLKEIHRDKLAPGTYLRTHPFVSDRVRVVHEEIEGKMRFEDYINREEGNLE
ncbi:MAG: M48 family metalloprotease [Candidatus Omnitrophica bacterium]|nr:M48 family metalloprotease [Candidatus Omnitrophota bacterium]